MFRLEMNENWKLHESLLSVEKDQWAYAVSYTHLGILNTDICYAISSLGHTDYLVIADPGLPIPENVTVIDISLVKGIPGFTEVFDAVTDELVIDSYIYAEEMETASTELLQYVPVSYTHLAGENAETGDFGLYYKK